MGWADAFGEALGRGVARGLNYALASTGLNGAGLLPRKRGRPPKPVLGYVSPARRCSADPGDHAPPQQLAAGQLGRHSPRVRGLLGIEEDR